MTMTMALFKESREPICPINGQHCSQWAKTYLKYCLCNMKDGVSLTLGLLSVMSWGVAEIPQIITNYKEKSTEGLSLAFLMTWIIGDLFNVFGCMLEPATLQTQYYMAMLYTITTVTLTSQTIYYGHIYPGLKCNRQHRQGPIPNQTDELGKIKLVNSDGGSQVNDAEKWRNVSNAFERTHVSSLPIPLPDHPRNSSPGRELYYKSARSLSSSHTPTAGSFLAQKMTPPSIPIRNSIEEPLLDSALCAQSPPSSSTRTMLCVVSALTFLGTLNLHQSVSKRLNVVFENKHQGYVMKVGRKMLQVGGGMLHENDTEGSSGIGTFLGWAMAAIYMGGRLPQICLNIRKGNVEGLNPLMFIFALVGNVTYVASILVNSMEWSKLRPNLPWLVDAGGCVLLDTFILFQFIYFRFRGSKSSREAMKF